MKERALYNVLRGNYTDDMKVVISKTEDGETIATGLRYLEHYWPELATNQLLISNFNDEHLCYTLPGILIELIKSKVIEEKDVIDYAFALSQDGLYGFIEKSFPSKICIPLYQKITDKNRLVKEIIDEISNLFPVDNNLVSVIVMVGDRDTFMKLLDKMGISRMRQSYASQSYFRGAAINKDALSWLSDGIFDSPTYLIMNFGTSSMKFASVMNIAKDVFDILRNGNDPREYASDILAWVDGEICYEILFQTGYFPYSFFTDELPRTPVLEKWLEQSVDI